MSAEKIRLYEKRERFKQISDLQTVLSTEQGRRVIWRILSMTGIYTDVQTTSPLEMARTHGSRKVGLDLLNILTKDFTDKFLIMQQEAFKDSKEKELFYDGLSKQPDSNDDNYKHINHVTGSEHFSDYSEYNDPLYDND